jgi:hypothetical protein
MPQDHRIALIPPADGRVEGIVVTVVIELGEGEGLSLIFVTEITWQDLDGDDIAIVSLRHGLQRLVPARRRDFFTVLSHG